MPGRLGRVHDGGVDRATEQRIGDTYATFARGDIDARDGRVVAFAWLRTAAEGRGAVGLD
jgi:hypothetical protein